jgi:hypothetical protein
MPLPNWWIYLHKGEIFMAKAKLVWLGKGVYTRAGKTYRNGDIMPDGIDQKELEGLKKKGKVGNPVKAVDVSETTALVEAQKKRIKELEAEIMEKNSIIANNAEAENAKTSEPDKEGDK